VATTNNSKVLLEKLKRVSVVSLALSPVVPPVVSPATRPTTASSEQSVEPSWVALPKMPSRSTSTVTRAPVAPLPPATVVATVVPPPTAAVVVA